MSITHLEKLRKIAQALIDGISFQHLVLHEGQAFHMVYEGEVVAKERARSAKGHHYTPPKTREFESKIRKLARARMQELGLSRFYRYCVVHLEINDAIPANWSWWEKRLATSGMMVASTGGDLDNKEKAILDAFNKVVFNDDRLVIQVFKHRRYSEKTGFKINIAQSGLTANDIINIGKLIGSRNAPQNSKN